ncbi:MAG: FHA domain-containing protein, partial [Planctomycetaceae bacterium]|nr:FHA domain-containing protein [Planctomycetaceae bacterium]
MFRLLTHYRERRLDHEFPLSSGQSYSLGRADERNIRIDWDSQVSRYQADLTVHADAVEVIVHVGASNALYVNGSPVTRCRLSPGESFVIGESRFELQQVTQSDSPGQLPVRQTAIRRNQLQRVRYDDADKRIDVLTNLPAVIRESGVERDLHVALTGMLLAGIPMADGVAIVSLTDDHRVRTLHYEQRFETGATFHPSSRLITSAIRERNSILHVWENPTGEHQEFTQMAGFHWAFCTPFSDVSGERAFYVTGRSVVESDRQSEQRLHADIKFTEFIA